VTGRRPERRTLTHSRHSIGELWLGHTCHGCTVADHAHPACATPYRTRANGQKKPMQRVAPGVSPNVACLLGYTHRTTARAQGASHLCGAVRAFSSRILPQSHPRILPLTLASCLSPSHLASHPRILPQCHPRILPQSHPRILPLTLVSCLSLALVSCLSVTLASCLSVTLASCLSLTLVSCPGEMVVTMSWTRAHPHHLTAGTCSRPPGRTAPLPSGSGHDGPSG